MPNTLTATPAAERVLTAARGITAGLTTPSSTKNAPLLPVLRALVGAATIQADAIADNAWDDCLPIPEGVARELAEACHRLGDTITAAAAAAPDCTGWSLPSMTGREFV
jgi:uncharacterized protein (DUF2336 family)